MEFSYKSLGHPVVFTLSVQTVRPTPIRFQVRDADRPYTYYMDRYNTIGGNNKSNIEDIIIRIPRAPQLTEFRVTNNKTNDDTGFRIVDKKTESLQTSMNLIKFKDPVMSSFIKFAEDFADRAGYLSAPGIYRSDNGRFVISYLPTIIDENGRELNTPARVSGDTKLVEVSQKQFKYCYTVGARLAILLHEFSHVFANKNMKDEIEADLHAAQIYLSLGYPRIELLNVFNMVFDGNDTEMNRKRMALMEKYIMNFDKSIVKVQYG
jgi:hypothetical protein